MGRLPQACRVPALLLVPAFFALGLAGGNPIDRWAKAVGGRDRVAAIQAIYREATIDIADVQGTIRVWHTADGRYRKEERVATYNRIEAFDGTRGFVQMGDRPVQTLAGADLERMRSTAFANTNAIFFALFPERRHGTVEVAGDGTIVLEPEGGIEWRVTLDPETALPSMMQHDEGGQTITVRFTSYETIDGLTLESAIARATGDPRFDAVIRFTKTVIDPPIDDSLFSLADASPPSPRR